MIHTRKIKNLTEIFSDSGYIHKIGTENYFKKGVINDSIDNYEEVSELPKFTEEEYKIKVRELIAERYDIKEELAIQRKAFNTLKSPLSENAERYLDEYNTYNSFVEECKVKAIEFLNNKSNGEEILAN